MIPESVLLITFQALMIFAAAVGVLLAVSFVLTTAILVISVFMGIEGPGEEDRAALELMIMRFVQTAILFCLSALCLKLWGGFPT